jgi:two-component system, chemotaxis family, sensor kinase CheA
MPGIRRDSEQSEFIQAFVDESREMLDNVEPLLIELEKRSDQSSEVDSEVLNTIFRLFHSLKGAAGFLELTTIGKVTHEAETLLDLFRKGQYTLNSQHIDLLNRTTDFIRNLLVTIEEELNDKGFEVEAEAIVHDLKIIIGQLKGELPQPEMPANTKASTKSEKTLQQLEDNEVDSQIEITPEMIKQFIAEAEELLETAENTLINLEKEPDNAELIMQAFRALHSFKGNAGFLGYSDLEKVSHQAETVLDSLRNQQSCTDSEILTLLLEIIDFLKGGIYELNEGRPPRIIGVQGLVSLLDDAAAKLGITLSPSSSPISPTSSSSLKIEYGSDDLTGNAGDLVKLELEAVASPPRRIEFGIEAESNGIAANEPKTAIEMELPADRRIGIDRRSGEDRRAGDRRASDKQSGQHQSIRVDVEKLDILMDLVGELVIAEAMVAQNPDLKGLNKSLDRFERSVLQLNKITRDLQDVATSIRMISLSGTFRKMIRLVRDLSQKSSKKVDLSIIGEETEVDKTVIEQINDPLVHIIRNSIDHGIETPEERERKGKSAEGQLTLEAKYMGGEVWITITDDGKGLDRDKILSKARERGLINDDGSQLRDEEVWQIIFQPGFSTADKVTDVSGRGVGMDVVKRNIESIRGKVEIRSEKNKGSIVILKIPLTLAIIDGMITRVNNNLYIIPIIAIRESFKSDPKYITRTMDGQEIVNIRGRLIPVARIHEIFNIKSNHQKLEDGIIIVVEDEHRQLCLFVDEVIRQQQVVIKGLSNYVGNVSCVSGCTILGDGDISLILDVPGIMNFVENGNGDRKKEGKHAMEIKAL